MKPEVSVIIACYNGERFLRETLESVFAQTLQDLEIILVDDGSTDSTASMASQVVDPRFSYMYQANQGPAAARNEGLKASCAPFVAFLDADDLWQPDMLGRCVAVLRGAAPSVGVVTTDYGYIDENGHALTRRGNWQPWTGNVFERLLQEIAYAGPAMLWRRECFERIGGIDTTPGVNDDWLNWLRIAALGCEFDAIPDKLVSIRRHGGNISRAQRARMISWQLRALDVILGEHDVEPQVAARAYARIQFEAALQLLGDGRETEAVDWFAKAVAGRPELLSQDATYYALAYAAVDEPTDALPRLDIELAEDRLRRVLDGAHMSRAERIVAAEDADPLGQALFCLARIAYAQGDSATARRCLVHALSQSPRLVRRPHFAGWAARIALGQRAVRGTKAFAGISRPGGPYG